MSILKQIYNWLLVALACSIVVTPALAQSRDTQHGHDLFLANGCYLCHGTVGQGGVAGPHIAVDLLPYVAVASYVRNASGRMPPFSEKILSDADLKSIYAYLGSLPKPRSPDSIPLLPNAEAGGMNKVPPESGRQDQPSSGCPDKPVTKTGQLPACGECWEEGMGAKALLNV